MIFRRYISPVKKDLVRKDTEKSKQFMHFRLWILHLQLKTKPREILFHRKGNSNIINLMINSICENKNSNDLKSFKIDLCQKRTGLKYNGKTWEVLEIRNVYSKPWYEIVYYRLYNNLLPTRGESPKPLPSPYPSGHPPYPAFVVINSSITRNFNIS